MQTIRRSVDYANVIVDVTNSNNTTMLPYYAKDNLSFISFMLLQTLHVGIEMKNLNFQVMLLAQKGVGTRCHPTITLRTTYAS